MRLGSASEPNVVVEAKRESYMGGATGDDIWVTVQAWVADFTGACTSCVVRRDYDYFVGRLAVLEQERRGEAVLESAVADELRLRIYASDHAGHMAVDVYLHRHDLTGEPTFRGTGIAFDPTNLPGLVQELRNATSAV